MPGLGASTGCVQRVVNANLARKEPLSSQHELLYWDAQNRLSEVQDNNGDMLEQYWHDAGGGRVKKVSGATTAISHYNFGSLRVAVKRGSALYHLHGDHLGSTSLTTAGSVVEASRTYYPYGAERSASGTLQTDRRFTGQKSDATGLLYYNARYYDPTLGTFISPDSLVPDPGRVIDYNRFLYARGNPLEYSDPSGNASCAQHDDGCWNNRWYLAHGYAKPTGGNHWSKPIQAIFQDARILRDILGEAGIEIDKNWDLLDPTEFRNARLLGQGVVAFGQKIGGLVGAGATVGLTHLRTLIGGGVTWYRARKGPLPFCYFGAACALEPGRIGFYDDLFTADDSYVRGTAVHELAHKIHFEDCGGRGGGCKALLNVGSTVFWATRFFPAGYRHPLTDYAWSLPREYWSEAVTDWVYGDKYLQSTPDRGNLTIYQKWFMNRFFRP